MSMSEYESETGSKGSYLDFCNAIEYTNGRRKICRRQIQSATTFALVVLVPSRDTADPELIFNVLLYFLCFFGTD